jgi:hypothetical protein
MNLNKYSFLRVKTFRAVWKKKNGGDEENSDGGGDYEHSSRDWIHSCCQYFSRNTHCHSLVVGAEKVFGRSKSSENSTLPHPFLFSCLISRMLILAKHIFTSCDGLLCTQRSLSKESIHLFPNWKHSWDTCALIFKWTSFGHSMYISKSFQIWHHGMKS